MSCSVAHSQSISSLYISFRRFIKTHLNSEIEKASIVNISSIAASQGFPDNPSYIKAALEGLTRSLAYDYSNIGIRVNCVRPGYVEADEYQFSFRQELQIKAF